MRIAAQMHRIQPDLAQQLTRAIQPFAAPGADIVLAQWLDQDIGHGHARIKRGIRILEHDLHPPPQRTQGLRRGRSDILAVEHHTACRRFHQPQQGPPERGLAATRFTDQAVGLATTDIEADAIHRRQPLFDTAEQAAAQRIAHHQILH